MKSIIVHLTPEQIEAIRPLMDEVAKMSMEGKPGICAAQIFLDHMRVGLIGHEKGRSTIMEMGGDPEARITSAY